QCQRPGPILAYVVFALNVNMLRLVAIETVEEVPVGARDILDARHDKLLGESELYQDLEDLVAGEFETRFAGGSDPLAADFAQEAARIDRRLAKPRIHQPDVRYAF